MPRLNMNPLFPVTQFRIARPTDQVEKVIDFYKNGPGSSKSCRLKDHDGCSENPYWKTNGITFEDPDKWRIVLMSTNNINL